MGLAFGVKIIKIRVIKMQIILTFFEYLFMDERGLEEDLFILIFLAIAVMVGVFTFVMGSELLEIAQLSVLRSLQLFGADVSSSLVDTGAVVDGIKTESDALMDIINIIK